MKTQIFAIRRALHTLARYLLISSVCYSGSTGAADTSPLDQNNALERPNILLIVADDLGYSDLGVMGSEISTPTLDRLAGSGLLLTNFHVAPACTATRAALLTGVDHHQAGVGNMKVLMAPNQVGQPGYEGVLNDRVVSFPALLRDAGYHTYISGKWDLGSEVGQWPVDRGFERSFALLEGGGNHFNDGAVVPLLSAHYVRDNVAVERPDGYSSDLFTDELLAFLQADLDDGKPFFAYAAYTAPHWPLQAREKDIEKYEEVYREGWDRLRAARFAKMKSLGIVEEALNLPPAWPAVPAWDTLPPERQRLEAKKMAVYAAMVENMDSNIGRLLDSLRNSGRLDNTVVIFMSDNGPDAANLQWQLPGGMAPALRWVYRTLVSFSFDNSLPNLGAENSHFSYGVGWAQLGATPLFMHKGLVSEGGIRVPLIVAQPSVYSGGRRSNTVTTLHDIAPTLLEMAAVKHPGRRYQDRDVYPMEGRSLTPLLSGHSERVYSESEPIGFEFVDNGALIMGEWKILRLNEFFGDGVWHLYNIEKDPGEKNDLSEEHPEIMARMQRAYLQYMEDKGVILPESSYFDNWIDGEEQARQLLTESME